MNKAICQKDGSKVHSKSKFVFDDPIVAHNCCLKFPHKEGGTNHGEVAAGAFTTMDKKTSNLNRKCKSKAQCNFLDTSC